MPQDADWLAAAERWCTGPVSVVRRTPLTGGYASADVTDIELDVAGRDGVTIIDGGNAKVAPAGVDLAVLRAQGADESDCYRIQLAAAGRQPDPCLLAVERHWADVHVHVAYLGFAADHLGADRVGEMTATASAALARLGIALSELG